MSNEHRYAWAYNPPAPAAPLSSSSTCIVWPCDHYQCHLQNHHFKVTIVWPCDQCETCYKSPSSSSFSSRDPRRRLESDQVDWVGSISFWLRFWFWIFCWSWLFCPISFWSQGRGMWRLWTSVKIMEIMRVMILMMIIMMMMNMILIFLLCYIYSNWGVYWAQTFLTQSFASLFTSFSFIVENENDIEVCRGWYIHIC